MATTALALDALPDAAGTHLGWSGWVEVTASHAAAFRRATGATSLEYLALSMTNLFLPELLEVTGTSMGVNYGTGAIRFGAPVDAGDRLRAEAEIGATEPVAGGVQAVIRITVHNERAGEPACTVESISRYFA